MSHKTDGSHEMDRLISIQRHYNAGDKFMETQVTEGEVNFQRHSVEND